MLEVILELCGKLSNKSQSELLNQLTKGESQTELLPENELKPILLEMLSGKINEVGQNNLKRGTREALTNLEKTARTKFNSTSTAQGVDLIESIVNSQVEAFKAGFKPEGGGTPDEITIESVKKLPFYPTLVDEIKNPFETRYSELETEYNTFKTGQLTNQKKAVVYKLAEQILERNKAILGEGDDRIKRVNFFNNSIPLDRLQLSEVDGKTKVVVLDSSGIQMVDPYQTPISYEQFIKDLNPYGFHKHDPNRSGTGGDRGLGGGTGGSSSGKWKTESEFVSYIQSPNLTDEQRQAAYKEFQDSNKKE